MYFFLNSNTVGPVVIRGHDDETCRNNTGFLRGMHRY